MDESESPVALYETKPPVLDSSDTIKQFSLASIGVCDWCEQHSLWLLFSRNFSVRRNVVLVVFSGMECWHRFACLRNLSPMRATYGRQRKSLLGNSSWCDHCGTELCCRCHPRRMRGLRRNRPRLRLAAPGYGPDGSLCRSGRVCRGVGVP